MWNFRKKENPGPDYETFADVYAHALVPFLEVNKGVIVHHNGRGYLVYKALDEENQGVQIRLIENEEALQYPDLAVLDVTVDSDDENKEVLR